MWAQTKLSEYIAQERVKSMAKQGVTTLSFWELLEWNGENTVLLLRRKHELLLTLRVASDRV